MNEQRIYFVNFVDTDTNASIGCAVIEISADEFPPDIIAAMIAEQGIPAQTDQQWTALVMLKCKQTQCFPPGANHCAVMALRCDHIDSFYQKAGNMPRHKFISLEEGAVYGLISTKATLENGKLTSLEQDHGDTEPVRAGSAWDA